VTLNADGTFSYTPDANFNGTDGFTYKANDGTADSNVAAVTITVNPVNDPPVAMNDHYSVAEDTPLTADAIGGVLRNDTDVEGNPLSAVLVDGPAHGTVTLNADGSFTYTPEANFNGADGFTYQANDGSADSTVAAVTITVDPVNDPPVAVSDSYSTATDAPLNVNAAAGVLANDTDVDGDSLAATLVAGPQHGTLTLNADGSFTYTPASGYAGADQFSYQASDGEADGNVVTVAITIGGDVNHPPVATDDSYSATQDQTLNVSAPGVLSNDTDAEGDPLTAAVVAGPQHGTLSLNADGSFSYTPNAGYTGADSFTYRANDGTADSNTATVSLTVSGTVNHRPAAVNDVYSTTQDSPLDVPSSGVLANDSDADGDPLTAMLFKGPQHGTLTLNADGSFDYTPDSGFSGLDSFSYQVSDGKVASTLAAVTLHVDPSSNASLRLASALANPSGTPASGGAGNSHVESLAAVMHDFELDGQSDLDPTAYPEDSMSAELSQGSKKIPGASEVDAVFDGLA
jgi:VCBS repeat-containing protein